MAVAHGAKRWETSKELKIMPPQLATEKSTGNHTSNTLIAICMIFAKFEA